MVLELQNFIGGEFVPCDTYIDSYNPSTGEVYAKIPDSSKDYVDQAVQAAQRAMKKWSATLPKERSAIMLKIADLLEERLEEFAIAESTDQGKPVWLARTLDIPKAVHCFRFFATAILHRINESTQLPEFNAFNYTICVPVGVAGLISPWNLPLYMLLFKAAPAIAAGCCVVAKPSEMTSVTAWMFCSLLKDAGLPAGVINVVMGTGNKTGSAIVEHPAIKVISFTGSTRTGCLIQERSARHAKKVSLELGGKNANVVFADANLEKCIKTSVMSAFANQGELCLCTSRFFIHHDVFDVFCSKYVKAVKENVKVGPPGDDTSTISALVSKEHLAKVKSYIDLAVKEGGKILCGETVDDLQLPEENSKGYFCQPTVITNLNDSSRCMKEEIFGPVVTISPFKTEEEVIERVNDVDYGLTACIWTQDVSRMHRVAPQIDSGTVWCNCWKLRDLRVPFGGTKMSGIGRECQNESLDFYSEQKAIYVQI